MAITKSETLTVGVIIVLLVAGVLSWDHFYGQGSQYLGKWTGDRSNATVTITRSGISYYVQDRSGKYPASLRNGQLVINMGGLSSTAFIEKQSGKLNIVFLGMTETYRLVSSPGN